MKVLRRSALGLLVIIIVAVGIGGALLWRTLPVTQGTFSVSGLQSETTIVRDSYGAPHIFAPSNDAAYTSLGFVHAQDRLWQMELLRRAGAGRLAEALGADFLKADIYLRAKRYPHHAEIAIAAMSPNARSALEHYAAGVNAVIKSGQLPPEMLLLGIKPQPWRSEDTMLALFALSEQLSAAQRTERSLAYLTRHLSADTLTHLIPTMDADEIKAYQDLFKDLGHAVGARDDYDLSKLVGGGLTATASNVWASSAHGQRILANDPHLALSLPPIWYLARIESPELAIRGATVPGLPFHISGQSRQMAWGVTVSGVDDADYIIERPSEDGTTVLRPNGTSPITTRHEVIAVKGGEPVNVTFRSTDRGPLLSDNDASIAALAPPGHLVALDWTEEAGADRTMDALYGLNHFSTWEDVRTAIRGITRPSLNILSLSADGTIGLTISGALPNRPGPGKIVCGAVPQLGWKASHGCDEGMMSDDAIPHSISRDGTPLYNANQPWPVDADWRLSSTSFPPVRAARIAELLHKIDQPSATQFSAMQNDTLALESVDFLATLIPLAVEAGATERAKWALETLSKWDHRMAANAVQPTLYAAWREMLFKDLLGDETDGQLFPFWEQRALLITRLMAERSLLCDDTTTAAQEDCPTLALNTLNKAMKRLSTDLGDDPQHWQWGNAHRAHLVSPFWRNIPVLSAWSSIDQAASGGSYTLNRAAPLYGDNGLADQHGAGYRGVYDLVEPVNSRFVLAGGNSGNPFSRYWRNLTLLWRDAGSISLSGDIFELEQGGGQSLVLTPLPLQGAQP